MRPNQISRVRLLKLGLWDMGLWSTALLNAYAHLFSAFTFVDGCDKNPAALVINDQAMIFNNLRESILKELDKQIPGIFNRQNLMLAATHTHAAPGGFGHLTLYNITTLDFCLKFMT